MRAHLLALLLLVPGAAALGGLPLTTPYTVRFYGDADIIHYDSGTENCRGTTFVDIHITTTKKAVYGGPVHDEPTSFYLDGACSGGTFTMRAWKTDRWNFEGVPEARNTGHLAIPNDEDAAPGQFNLVSFTGPYHMTVKGTMTVQWWPL